MSHRGETIKTACNIIPRGPGWSKTEMVRAERPFICRLDSISKGLSPDTSNSKKFHLFIELFGDTGPKFLCFLRRQARKKLTGIAFFSQRESSTC
jgi:hypothetical protein